MHYTMNLNSSPLNFSSAVGGMTARADTPPSSLGMLLLGDGGGAMGGHHFGLHSGSPSGITSASTGSSSYAMHGRKLDDMGTGVDGSGRRPEGHKSLEIQNATINSLVDEDFLNHYKVHEITGGMIPALSPPPPPPPPSMGPGGANGAYSPYSYPHSYDFYPAAPGECTTYIHALMV